MPLYEYVCRDCDQEVEVLVRSADEKPECPECDSDKLTKLLSVPATPGSATERVDLGPAGNSCGSGCECFPDG